MKLKNYAIAAIAGIGAARVLIWLNNGIAALLLSSGWEASEAVKAAPVILISLGCGLALSLYGMYKDGKRYESGSPYGKVEGYSARQKAKPKDKEIGA